MRSGAQVSGIKQVVLAQHNLSLALPTKGKRRVLRTLHMKTLTMRVEVVISRAMISEKKYVLISPCRNEAIYMRQTLESVINQSIRPANGSSSTTGQRIKLLIFFENTKVSMIGLRSSPAKIAGAAQLGQA